MRMLPRVSGWWMWVWVCLGFLVAAFPACPEPFSDSVQVWSALSLRESRPVQGVKLAIGHVTLTLAAGDAAYVVAGGETVGLFFRGDGTLDYIYADRVEL